MKFRIALGMCHQHANPPDMGLSAPWMTTNVD
jgi:hypothetical protein